MIFDWPEVTSRHASQLAALIPTLYISVDDHVPPPRPARRRRRWAFENIAPELYLFTASVDDARE